VAFTFTSPTSTSTLTTTSTSTSTTSLGVSIGLGPEQAVEEEEGEGKKAEKVELVAGVDYEVPDHESYRTSRRSKLDEQCDQWFGTLLGDEKTQGVLGSLADDAREILTTPVPLVNEVRCYDRRYVIDSIRLDSMTLLWFDQCVALRPPICTLYYMYSYLSPLLIYHSYFHDASILPYCIVLYDIATGGTPDRSRGMDSICQYKTSMDTANTCLWFGGIRSAGTEAKRRNMEAL
jgi:hypothetical protein